MTRCRKLAFALIAGVLVCAVAATLFSGREPIYKHKTWSQWLEEVDYGQPEAIRTEAATAIRGIGTNLLPRLVSDLHPNGSALKWRLISLVRRQSLVKLKITSPDERCRRAAWGIHALGLAARPIAPELIRLFDANPGYALGAYASAVGPEAIPVLTQALTHTNQWVRWNAAGALWDFTPSETLDAVPFLVAGLADTNLNVRLQMGNVLRHLHPDEYERVHQKNEK
jgi:hypothetical protein